MSGSLKKLVTPISRSSNNAWRSLGCAPQILDVCLHVFGLVDDHAARDPPVYGCFSVMGKINAERRFEQQ